jgi:hypothetical protein
MQQLIDIAAFFPFLAGAVHPVVAPKPLERP